jgi:hypothetical protein
VASNVLPSRRLLVLLLVAWLSGTTAADRETAEFVAQRADKALVARSWAEAEGLYRKALEEDATLLRARLGLGEALLGSGQRAAGIAEIRQFVDEAGALAAPTPALAALLAKARKRLVEMDTLGTELDQRIDAHVAALVAFAGRWREKDPDIAVEALEQALRLRPGQAKAAEALDGLRQRAPAVVTALFNGKDATGWTWLQPPMWQVRDGILVAKADGQGFLARTDTQVRGEFDVRMEARFVLDWGNARTFLLCPCMKQEFDTMRFGVRKEHLIWEEVTAADDVETYGTVRITEIEPAFDLMAWNVYELRYGKSEVTALVNGRELFRKPRPAARDGGFVGLLVEDCTVEFRRVELSQR